MNSSAAVSIEPLGESAYLIKVGDEIDARGSTKILALRRAVLASNLIGVVDCVPAYTSLLVRFDPDIVCIRELEMMLRGLADREQPLGYKDRPPIKVPVIYGGDSGPDLEAVADHAGLTVKEVVRLHTAPEYTVAFLGFLPGFPYLFGLDPSLACPRLATPRVSVPAGSVGIAGAQTGIYPLDSPGGWRIIGHTTLRLFDPLAEPPTLFQPGDRVRFVPIAESDCK